MRLTLILGALVLASCEKYTDATSPCFGTDGEPAVTRASMPAVSFATSPETDCDFEDMRSTQ